MHVCMPAAAECFPAVVVWGGGCCSVDSSCFETKAVWQCVSGPGAVVVAILVQGGRAGQQAASKTDWQCDGQPK